VADLGDAGTGWVEIDDDDDLSAAETLARG
jgi:hypothetical protein